MHSVPLTFVRSPQSRSAPLQGLGAVSHSDQQSTYAPSSHANHEGISMDNRRASVSRHFQTRGGNILPRVSTSEVIQGQADVLQSVYNPLKKPAQQLSADAGTCERAARNHLAAQNAMNLTDFFNACRAIPELRAWGAKMMGMEADMDPRFQEDLAKFIRAAQTRLSERGGA